MLHIVNHDLELEQQVQAMFHKVLTGWAQDAMSLRQRGLDRPSARPASGSSAGPVCCASAHSTPWHEPAYPSTRNDFHIAWGAESLPQSVAPPPLSAGGGR